MRPRCWKRNAPAQTSLSNVFVQLIIVTTAQHRRVKLERVLLLENAKAEGAFNLKI